MTPPAIRSTTLAALLTFMVVCWGACGGSSTPAAPEASLSASTVTFAGQDVNTTSLAAQITLRNRGDGTLRVSGISISGTNSSEFGNVSTCGSDLAPGAACQINITFTPATAGSKTATLSVSDNAAGSPHSITLKGTGITPGTSAPLGAAAGISVPCASIGGNDPGSQPNGSCYNVTLACPGIADQVVGVKVNNPSGNKGTVTFMVGGGGKPWYDTNFTFGQLAVDLVAKAGFTTAQINFYDEPVGFPNGGTFAGWLTGPGGPRALSCRFATVSMWVRDHIRQANAPFCHTGNSAGSGAPFYALAYYGFDAYYNFVELSSGPPFTRIDKGCICNPEEFFQVTCGGTRLQSECYRVDGTMFVDPAYDPLTHICTDAMDSGNTENKQLFIHDSLDSFDAVKAYPNVKIHFVFGALDTGSAQAQAMEWIPQISGQGPITFDCVADAPHALPDVQDGAEKIANDIIASCQ